MTSDSIDFQLLPDDVPVRRSFRVPVSRKDNILAVFNGQTYAVDNLSATGIAIHAQSCLEFRENQILENSELMLGTRRLAGLTAKVVHCSVYASGKLCFGLVWMEMDDPCRAVLDETLNALKLLALKEGQGQGNND